jgi:hypothetical protein
MCRNIRVLFNFDPPATKQEVEAAALQFVRKVSGTSNPSRQNQQAFQLAVREVTNATHRLLESLVTQAPPKDREAERDKAVARAKKRFGE